MIAVKKTEKFPLMITNEDWMRFQREQLVENATPLPALAPPSILWKGCYFLLGALVASILWMLAIYKFLASLGF